MSAVETFLTAPLASDLGRVLLHFLWQGAAVAALLALVLRAMRDAHPERRYQAACVALVVMVLAPVLTYLRLASTSVVGQEQALALVERLPGAASASIRDLLLPVLGVCWVLGSALAQLRTLWQWRAARHLCREATQPLAERWQRTVRRMSAELGLRTTVRVMASTLARVPTVVGHLSPVVLVPVAALARLSPEQLRAVLAHELAHVRRYDYAINLMQAAVEAVLFFHPAVWWLSNRLRVEREYCCDDVAVALCGDAIGYARALERLETFRGETAVLAPTSNGGSLMNRIQRLLRREDRSQRQSFLPALSFVAAGLLSSAAFGLGATPAALVQDERSIEDLEGSIRDLRQRLRDLDEELAELRGGRRRHAEPRRVHVERDRPEVHVRRHQDPGSNDHDDRDHDRQRRNSWSDDHEPYRVEVDLDDLHEHIRRALAPLRQLHGHGDEGDHDGNHPFRTEIRRRKQHDEDGRSFQFRFPRIQWVGPDGEMQGFDGDNFRVEIPDFEMPDFEALNIRLPDFEMPEMDDLHWRHIEIPDIDIDIPEIRVQIPRSFQMDIPEGLHRRIRSHWSVEGDDGDGPHRLEIRVDAEDGEEPRVEVHVEPEEIHEEILEHVHERLRRMHEDDEPFRIDADAIHRMVREALERQRSSAGDDEA